MDMSLALVEPNGRILYPNRDFPRSKFIWYGGCQYHRIAERHGSKCYIVQFISETKAHIEYVASKEHYIVDVDDANFILTERKGSY